MKKGLVAMALLILVLVYFFYPETVVTYPAGITAPDQPKQTNITETREWNLDEFRFKALAEYQIKARVLKISNIISQ